MYDVLFGSNEYPLTVLWIEYNAPSTVDDSITYEGAVPVKCRRVKNTSQREQRVNGLKETTYFTTIKTKDELPFKAKDKIKIGSKIYSIKSADQVENDVYKDSRIIYQNFLDFETELILE
jgi:hypothetical protein